jgi:hypothetical protein
MRSCQTTQFYRTFIETQLFSNFLASFPDSFAVVRSQFLLACVAFIFCAHIRIYIIPRNNQLVIPFVKVNRYLVAPDEVILQLILLKHAPSLKIPYQQRL